MCGEVESTLDYLELVCDTQEHQERMLNEKFNLLLYRETKIKEMTERKS
jgi:hypothetical protein